MQITATATIHTNTPAENGIVVIDHNSGVREFLHLSRWSDVASAQDSIERAGWTIDPDSAQAPRSGGVRVGIG